MQKLIDFFLHASSNIVSKFDSPHSRPIKRSSPPKQGCFFAVEAIWISFSFTRTAVTILISKGAVNMAQIYGYARVSTREQNEERQLVAMRNYGVAEPDIFLDKQSGKDFDRKAYRKLLKKLRPGDILVIKSIDRLWRDYGEVPEQWRFITKEKKADVVVLDIPLLDTRNHERDLTRTFVTDLVLQILSYVAQQERDFIHQRQTEGIEAAKARGVKFGRPPIKRPDTFDEVYKSWECGEISAREAGRRLGVNYKTFQAWVGK